MKKYFVVLFLIFSLQMHAKTAVEKVQQATPASRILYGAALTIRADQDRKAGLQATGTSELQRRQLHAGARTLRRKPELLSQTQQTALLKTAATAQS